MGIDEESGYIALGGLVFPATNKFRFYRANHNTQANVNITKFSQGTNAINIHGGGHYTVAG